MKNEDSLLDNGFSLEEPHTDSELVANDTEEPSTLSDDDEVSDDHAEAELPPAVLETFDDAIKIICGKFRKQRCSQPMRKRNWRRGLIWATKLPGTDDRVEPAAGRQDCQTLH
jgi:hypothetical protein